MRTHESKCGLNTVILVGYIQENIWNKPVSERETMLGNRVQKRANACFTEQKLSYINRNEYGRNHQITESDNWESKVGKMTDEIFQDRQTGYSRIGLNTTRKQVDIYINILQGRRSPRAVRPWNSSNWKLKGCMWLVRQMVSICRSVIDWCLQNTYTWKWKKQGFFSKEILSYLLYILYIYFSRKSQYYQG